MIGISDLHDYIMYYIIIIVSIISYLIIAEIRREKNIKNGKKELGGVGKWNHSTITEIIWTVSPAIILVLIGIPSFKLLYIMDKVNKPEISIKVKGLQWYWNYEIEDKGLSINIDSYTKTNIEKGDLRLLSVDNPLIIPKRTKIRFIVTSEDVIHSFAMPELGIKVDGIPGRLNQISIESLKGGIYYGQCSELCGNAHSSMSIELHSVPKKDYISYLISENKISVNNIIKITKSFKEILKTKN